MKSAADFSIQVDGNGGRTRKTKTIGKVDRYGQKKERTTADKSASRAQTSDESFRRRSEGKVSLAHKVKCESNFHSCNEESEWQVVSKR